MSKLHFGPLWDFDLTMGSVGTHAIPSSPEGLFVRDLGLSRPLHQDSGIEQQTRARWAELRPAFTSVVDSILTTDARMSQAKAADAYRWGYAPAVEDTGAFLSDWLTARMNYLDQAL